MTEQIAREVNFPQQIAVLDLVDKINAELGIQSSQVSFGSVGGQPAVFVHNGTRDALGGIAGLHYVVLHDGRHLNDLLWRNPRRIRATKLTVEGVPEDVLSRAEGKLSISEYMKYLRIIYHGL